MARGSIEAECEKKSLAAEAKSRKIKNKPTWTVHAPQTLIPFRFCDNREESAKVSKKRKLQEMTAQAEKFTSDIAAWQESHNAALASATELALKTGCKLVKPSVADKPEAKSAEYENMVARALVTSGEIIDLGIENDCYNLFESAVRQLEAQIMAWFGIGQMPSDELVGIKNNIRRAR